MKPRISGPNLVYYPVNGCVLYEKKILVRLVYGNEEITEAILEAIKNYVEKPRTLNGRAPGS